jgi:multiple sugar transport system ATP-binding protein
LSDLLIRNLTKLFSADSGVRDLSLTVKDGEFFVLLGPSGCGKSTLLRLIAGLEEADGGEIRLGEGDHDEGRFSIAMVFQNYALYPHMSAFENIAFPLKLKKVPRGEISRRVQAAANLAGLKIELGRRPAELSGGERQRVALARALVREPSIILMDEPLSNLDAQLRTSLRMELKEFQKRVRRTVIFVTHDQIEALTLADRLGVMRAGRLEQIGTPEEVYRRPANQFVASFIGQPPMNLLPCEVSADRRSLKSGEVKIEIAPPGSAGANVILGIRPEAFSLAPRENWASFEVQVVQTEFVGGRYLIHARMGEIAIVTEFAEAPEDARVRFYVDPEQVHFFDPDTGMRLE